MIAASERQQVGQEGLLSFFCLRNYWMMKKSEIKTRTDVRISKQHSFSKFSLCSHQFKVKVHSKASLVFSLLSQFIKVSKNTSFL